MSKNQKTKKIKNVETVENWKEYFNDNFETIELTIKYAKEVNFILKRVISHLELNRKFPQNLYISALESIVNWIDISIELHYKQQDFLLNKEK